MTSGFRARPWTSASLSLVAIADTLRDGLEELVTRSRAAVESGATSVHLRLKGEDARTLLDAGRALLAALPVPVILHDRADVAVAAGAAGVHLSPDELPATAARAVLRPGMVVGVSVGSPSDVEVARAADYASIGPIFAPGGRVNDATALGLEEFARFVRGVGIPVMAVGGIAPDNVRDVLHAGASGVAVITGAFGKAESARAIQQLRDAIGT